MYLYSKLSCIFHLQFLCFLVMLALQCTFFSVYACFTMYLHLWLCLLYNLPSSRAMLALQYTFFSGYDCFTIYLLLWLCFLFNLPFSRALLALQFTFFSGLHCPNLYFDVQDPLPGELLDLDIYHFEWFIYVIFTLVSRILCQGNCLILIFTILIDFLYNFYLGVQDPLPGDLLDLDIYHFDWFFM